MSCCNETSQRKSNIGAIVVVIAIILGITLPVCGFFWFRESVETYDISGKVVNVVYSPEKSFAPGMTTVYLESEEIVTITGIQSPITLNKYYVFHFSRSREGTSRFLGYEQLN